MEEINRQVAIYMQGAEFGDLQIKDMMVKELRQRLFEARAEGRPLRVYCGYDVTAPDIHLGHTITMRKLRQFQEFGHQVTFLIGSFTTLIGDPSDRDQARSSPIQERVKQNAQTYAEQAFKILDPLETAVRYNDEWLSKLTFADILKVASLFTVQQFLTRDRLQNRIERNEPLWLQELLYPLAQGYDAFFLQADVQIGASEQLFNLMAGRKIQEALRQKPQICITYPILIGTDGKMKMSKSLGNYIGINEPAEQQYGKVMSIPDELILHYFKLTTRWLPQEVEALANEMQEGRLHPMEAKKKLAWEIVDIFHGDAAANVAAENFMQVHQTRGLPSEVPEFHLNQPTNIIDVLVKTKLCASKSEAKRAVEQSSIKVDGQTVSNIHEIIRPGQTTLQRGRRNFMRLNWSK